MHSKRIKNRYSNSSGRIDGPSTYRHLFSGIEPGKQNWPNLNRLQRVLKSAGKSSKRKISLAGVA